MAGKVVLAVLIRQAVSGLKGTSKNPHFIPTDVTTSHSTRLSKDDSLVAGYAALRQRGKQASRIAAARKKFLTYISCRCGAAKFFARLAFGRNLNF
jgi:hypothetical protein